MRSQVLKNMKKACVDVSSSFQHLLIQERTRPGQNVDLEALEGKNRILLANESHGCPSKSVRLLEALPPATCVQAMKPPSGQSSDVFPAPSLAASEDTMSRPSPVPFSGRAWSDIS